MNDLVFIGSRCVRSFWLAAALFVSGGAWTTAHASVVQISAEFAQDSSDPRQNEFTNTTPWSGVCAGARLRECKANNWWSIDTGIRGTKLGDRSSAGGRGSMFLRFPGVRSVTLTSAEGASYEVQLYIIGGALRLTDNERDGDPNPAHAGMDVGAGCKLGITNGSPTSFASMRMFIRSDQRNPAPHQCATRHLVTNNFDIANFDFTYALVVPARFSMRSGTYTGSVTYSVGGTGSGADFDLGDNVQLTDDQIQVNFDLQVRHDLAVMFPDKAPVVHLAPAGGWEQWTEYGKVPQRLQQRLPFQISSSGEFEVSLRCDDHRMGDRCAIQNAVTGTTVPINTTISLSSMLVKSTGELALTVPLEADRSTRFAPRDYSPGHPAHLEFSVDGIAVKSMVDEGASRWQGQVTVIFDPTL